MRSPRSSQRQHVVVDGSEPLGHGVRHRVQADDVIAIRGGRFPHGDTRIGLEVFRHVGEHQPRLLNHAGEPSGFQPSDQVNGRGRRIEPPANHVPALAKELLHPRDHGVGILFRERGKTNHVAKRMRHVGGGMRLEARECGHVPPTRQQREFKETVLKGVQDRCLICGHHE